MPSNRLVAVLFVALITFAASSCSSKESTQATADAKPNGVSQANQAMGQTQRSGGSEKQGSGSGPRETAPAPLVVTVPVRKASFASEVEALGTAKANEAIDITSKVSNRVKTIRFREGQNVRAGDILVELDPEEVAADLAVAEAALNDSKSQVKRSRELFQTKVLSAQQMEQLEATMQGNEARVASAKARLNDQIVRAPFNGRVGLRNVSVGGLVSPGTVITTLD
ncbi:MAG TPA: efflux RND transporter periplasmic adaptor subunit, partial [Steroidobacteraceae bacterium]|nr:efflux RND transporter periplasmic adaptor subunit [Steroidobacteraceae bacterium]